MRKTAITAGLLALITHAVAQDQGQERPRQGGVSYPPGSRAPGSRSTKRSAQRS